MVQLYMSRQLPQAAKKIPDAWKDQAKAFYYLHWLRDIASGAKLPLVRRSPRKQKRDSLFDFSEDEDDVEINGRVESNRVINEVRAWAELSRDLP